MKVKAKSSKAPLYQTRFSWLATVMLTYDSEIIIVGSGVFGISTALWLARAGYKNITVFDRCEFDKNHYDPFNGCDGASSDINKIFRATYGSSKEYQELAYEARDMWLDWDRAIEGTSPALLPHGLTHDDKLINFCGCYYLGEGSELQPHYADSLEMTAKEAPEYRKLQFLKVSAPLWLAGDLYHVWRNLPDIKGSAIDEENIRREGAKWFRKYHVLDKINKNATSGFLDIGAGINLADKVSWSFVKLNHY
jgi:sarcosine oxidase / L-pipecolate oxidase